MDARKLTHSNEKSSSSLLEADGPNESDNKSVRIKHLMFIAHRERAWIMEKKMRITVKMDSHLLCVITS